MAVTRLEITTRRPLARGKSFGEVGSYEQLLGKAYFAVDPRHPLNTCITDIALAPKGADDLIHFSADFSIIKPVNPALGNRRLLLGVPNRGNKIGLRFNYSPLGPEPPDGPAPGDGFLFEQGYTIAECGWEFGLPPGALSIDLPQATGPEGPVPGKSIIEWQPTRPRTTLPFSEAGFVTNRPYPAAELNDREASLTVRGHQFGERRRIDRNAWQFAREADGKPVPNATSLYLAEGFAPGGLYELVYQTRGAPVVGLGLLAVRDIVSFLRDASRTAPSVGTGDLDFVYGCGISQTGRFLRHMLYLGLNEGADGKRIFDGILSIIAGGRRGQFNQRFGNTSNLGYLGAENLFPFADAEQADPLTGAKGSLIAPRASQLLPRIIYTNSSQEYWTAGTSLTHTDVQGMRDISPPDNVRTFLMAGTQHSSGTLPLSHLTPTGERARYPLNSVDYVPIIRSALVNLDLWVREGIVPPDSVHPRISDGSAVAPERLKPEFARIPGVDFPSPMPQIRRLDFGPEWPQGIASVLPPVIGEPYITLVSTVDDDGNEVAGIRLPEVAVPLATYIGWNLRDKEVGAEDEVMLLRGGTLPFPRDAAEREAAGDTRLSIAERYASKEEYLAQFRRATEELVEKRYLLAIDIDRMMKGAAQRWDLFTAKEKV